MNRSREARITRHLAFLYCAVVDELLTREENNTYGDRESEYSRKLCYLAVRRFFMDGTCPLIDFLGSCNVQPARTFL